MALTLKQLELRVNSLGGSDAAVAVGLSPYKTALELYMEKTGLVKPEDIGDVDAVYWGNRLENIVAEEYARRSGNDVKVEEDTFYHSEHKFLTAHLDRSIPGLNRILECKTANAYIEKEWGDTNGDEIPMHYIIQVQHCMNVTNINCADVAVLIGGQDFRIYTIQRDDDLIADLERAEISFWQRVKDLNPPDPVNNDDLKLLYGLDNGEKIITTQETYGAWASLTIIKAEIKALETEQVELEFVLKSFMGNHSMIVHQDKVKPMVTWANQDCNRFNASLFKEDHPKLHAKYVENKPQRVLRLKK